jgi:hypothetical protein
VSINILMSFLPKEKYRIRLGRHESRRSLTSLQVCLLFRKWQGQHGRLHLPGRVSTGQDPFVITVVIIAIAILIVELAKARVVDEPRLLDNVHLLLSLVASIRLT